MPGEIQSAPPQPIAFGKYTLLERISHGGMAEVFRAKTQGTAGFERVVAIKLLLPQVANDSDFVTMLIDEAKIAGQLSHANIAQIFDLGQVDGRYYIVQEYVPGRDLRAICHHLEDHHGRLSPAQTTHIILKICEALDYAHNKRDGAGQPLNLVHRDISPQNIIVSHEGEVKLIDFGIVKAEGRQTRTLAGLVKGKFAYMSPEQIRGLPVDRRSDVFACGIILHELLTGEPLFKRGSEFETLQRARAGEIVPPSHLNPAVPVDLDRVVLRALARHVDDRYQSAIALRDDLWDVVRAHHLYHSRDQLGAWMLETFGGPGTADLEPASSVDLAPVGPGAGPPRSRPAGRPMDDDDDAENMTVVDPDLQGRLRHAIEDGDGDTVAAILGSSLSPPPGGRAPTPRPGGQATVRNLAEAAHEDPGRAVFRSGPADSVLDLVASELAEHPPGDDEDDDATRAHPNLQELIAESMASSSDAEVSAASSSSVPTGQAGGWAEPQTPTRRRGPLDGDDPSDDGADPIARLAGRLPPPALGSRGAPAGRGRAVHVSETAKTSPYLPFDPVAAVAARGQPPGSGSAPGATAGPDQRTIGLGEELPVPALPPPGSYPPPAYPQGPGAPFGSQPPGPPMHGSPPPMHGSPPPMHGSPPPMHGAPPYGPPGSYPSPMPQPPHGSAPSHLPYPPMHGRPGMAWPGAPPVSQPGTPGVGRIWILLAVVVLVAALTISIVLAVTSG